MSLRNFFRLLRRGSLPDLHVDDSLARAVKDSAHTCTSGAGPSTSTSGVYEHIEKGHKNYAESFKKKKK